MKSTINLLIWCLVLGFQGSAIAIQPNPINEAPRVDSILNHPKKSDLIQSEFLPGELTHLCEVAIIKAHSKVDLIVKFSQNDLNFDNTVLAFESLNADLSDEAQPLAFMKSVSPNKAVNSEGAKCEQALNEFGIKTFGRRDLYNVLKDQKPRTPAETRLLQKTLEAFESNGLKLPDEQLRKVTDLFSKLNDLQTQYSENLNTDNTTVELTPEELAGVSSDFFSRLKKTVDGTRYTVTTKVTDYTQVMENARSEEARKKMAIAYNNRQGESNTKLLEEAILVRQQIAVLMGYRTWADYQLSHGRTAKDAQTVTDFLGSLKGKLSVKNQQDIAQLLKFKKTFDPGATEVKAWDVSYLSYQLKKRDFQLDDDQIREYFPSDLVIQGMFNVYSQIFGVRYERVSGARVWSPDVKAYKIIDQKDGQLLGYFYTDFIPRSNKYSHFAAFPLISGRILPGGYSRPVAAIVGNFNPPANGKPSLLNHSEVVTLFHEFGHIMHQTLTRAPYASLSGSSVAQDFVEAPSQMLENWPWQEKILNLISGHYQDPTKKLPKELLTKMIAARDFQEGYYFTRQLTLAMTDMSYHTSTGPVNSAVVYDKIFKDLTGINPIPGGHFAASFGHLMGGYDAGYYGYLWSLVYATDMFTSFDDSDCLNAQVGSRYRQIILEKGNMENATDLLTQFLGRPTNSKAFFKKLHITF